MNNLGSTISGTGSYVPPRLVSNEEVAAHLEVDASYIARVSGIQARYWVDPDVDCSFLAEQAARRALDQAGLQPKDLDCIIVSSTSPDFIFPSTACLVQARLGERGLPAFDCSASCSGFLYGLSMADSFIRSHQYRRCLVVASEIKSRSLDLQDLGTAILFGDGAGAAIVEPSSSETHKIMSIRLHADGGHHDAVKIFGGGSRRPLSEEVIKANEHTLRIQGSKLYRLAVRRVIEAVTRHVEEEKWEIPQLEQVVFHQANGRMLTHLCQKLHLPIERCVNMIEQIGNTSSASLPIALDHVNRTQRLNVGDRVLLGAFGGGLTWGTALVRWG